MLLLGLFLAHEFLGLEIPGEVLSKIEADSAIGLLVQQVRREFDQPGRPANIFMDLFFQIATRERLRDKIKYLSRLGVTLNTRDWQVLNLPALLKSFYYLVRPFACDTCASALGQYHQQVEPFCPLQQPQVPKQQRLGIQQARGTTIAGKVRLAS